MNGQRIFLLGGHDLEMMEIRRLLEHSHEEFCDKDLRWANAELDAYSDVMRLNPGAHFIGVELRDANHLSAFCHYTLVDHHNDYSHRPAAILQVATLLGVEPDRYMQMVAANDAGYIPALKAMGADESEIAAIRRRDRAAQGVTEEDERLAELSVSDHLVALGPTMIVRSLTSCFSPICDLLFPYERLLIYTSEEWTFYGDGKAEIVSAFDEGIKSGRVFHGGGDKGYVGAAPKAFSASEINDFVNTIIKRYESL